MTVLVVAEHDNASLRKATLHAVAAAQKLGGELHLLVAGHQAQAAAKAGAQVAGVALGVSAAVADMGGETHAWVNGDIGQTPGMTVRDVRIEANAEGKVEASATQAALGFGFGLTGAVAVADFDGKVEATVGAASDIKATRDITVKASGDVDALADAIAGTLSIGGAMGASLSFAMARPALTTRVNGNLTSTTSAGKVSLQADSKATALSNSLSVAGGLVFGAAGAYAHADASPVVDAYLASGGSKGKGSEGQSSKDKGKKQ